MGGIWVLVIIVTVNGQIQTLPWLVYEDAQFGYYQCQQDKKTYAKTLVSKYTLTCTRIGES